MTPRSAEEYEASLRAQEELMRRAWEQTDENMRDRLVQVVDVDGAWGIACALASAEQLLRRNELVALPAFNAVELAVLEVALDLLVRATLAGIADTYEQSPMPPQVLLSVANSLRTCVAEAQPMRGDDD